MTYAEFKEGFLPEFLNIKSFAGKIKYANERLPRIGSGSGRIVYDIDGEKVLKLAKNAKGVAQNEAEAGAGYYRDTQHIVTEIFDGAQDDTWLIVEKGKKVGEKRIKELTGIPSLFALNTFLRNTHEQNNGRRKIYGQDKEIEEFFWENEFTNDLTNFIANYGQHVGDMGRPSSYGEVLRDGQPTIVLTDYGLNDEVFATHYDPFRKQQHRMYELFNYADGNDDILSDTGDQGDIRRGMWAQVPYSVSDGPGVINEEFIEFVNNRQDYPDKPILNLPVLTDRFHECVNNIGEVMRVVENRGRFYNNLLELQDYLTKHGFYNRDPLMREAYHINEDTPGVEPDTLTDRNYADRLAKEVAGKLSLGTPKYLGAGDNGFAYTIDNKVVMKITTDISEADSSTKLMRGQPTYLAKTYNLYKILDTDNNLSFFVILQENILDKPLEKFRKIEADIEKLMPAGMDMVDIMQRIKRPANFDYNQMAEVAKQVMTINPEANVSNADREAAYEFIIGILNIRQELIEFDIKSVDYVRIANLGYNDGVLKYFDIGGYYGVSEPDIPDEDVINLPEDGSAKFTTDNAVNQDDFPVYNTNDTSPSINNNLQANTGSQMYEDLEYNHVDGDATQDEYKLEERDKSYGKGSKTVKVKRKCQLAGLGNTSVACNQGDINNLEFGSVNEGIISSTKTYWAWVSPDNRFIEVPKLNHKGYIMQVYKDEEFGWDYDRVFDKALEDGWVRVIFEYERFQGNLSINGNEKQRVYSVFKSMFADAVKYGNNHIVLEWYNPKREYATYSTRDAEGKAKVAQIVAEEIKNLDLREYFSSLAPMNETKMTIQNLPFKAEIEKNGGEIFAVGGSVRDELLGKDSKDLDIVIRGIPEDKLAGILKKYGTVNPVGASFAVTKFVPNGGTQADEVDIALPRTEVSTGEGHKDFEIKADYRLPIEKDLERRDFTLNAIAQNVDGDYIDPFNGQEDLKAGKLKITHPMSFVDDALRMLRAIRFASIYGFDIDPETYKLIAKSSDKITTIDKDRIQNEFGKIVKEGDAGKAAFLLKDTGMLRAMGVDAGLLASRVWDEVNTVGEFVYLLSHNAMSPVDFYKQNLRGDTNIIAELQGLMAGMEVETDDPMVNRTIAHNMVVITKGTEILKSKILPEKLQVAAQELLQGKYPQTVKDLAVDGNDLMAVGLRGKEIGDAQKMMLMKVYKDEVRNSKEDLLSLVDKKPEDVEEGYLNYSDMRPSTWNVNGREVTIDFFVHEYDKWNNQGGRPGYPDASHESVLEFLQNNYEDFSVDNKLRKELYWELTDRDVLNEEDVKKISYTAVVLDEKSHSTLLQVLGPMIPKDWKIYAHHMTINMGPIDNKDLLGESAELQVTSFAKDNLVMAVGVNSDIPSTNKIPHVTVAVNVNAGGKPFLSNKLTDWKPLGFPLTLTGKVTEVE